MKNPTIASPAASSYTFAPRSEGGVRARHITVIAGTAAIAEVKVRRLLRDDEVLDTNPVRGDVAGALR